MQNDPDVNLPPPSPDVTGWRDQRRLHEKELHRSNVPGTSRCIHSRTSACMLALKKCILSMNEVSILDIAMIYRTKSPKDKLTHAPL
ncbi:hypothetical protein P154DRAFT_523559 [Amniculicola lignicola CBS 123094]|uniref:Uncharacterized protein n=1 Tax=Amniculicola lignicola CBS 123094 TaxID=1392246 RepID=A0A6A5WE33_9PLEO|nr:hypothetical protein P154DRAFT_523559 [Amniculicola lignicola CBS 123094]